MARYIDAYSLSDKVFESKKNNPHLIDVVKRSHNCEHEHFLKLIDDEPTADVVEVVRCKDCKHYEIHKPSVTLNCERGGRVIPMMPDDFCSYGERKKGADK